MHIKEVKVERRDEDVAHEMIPQDMRRKKKHAQPHTLEQLIWNETIPGLSPKSSTHKEIDQILIREEHWASTFQTGYAAFSRDLITLSEDFFLFLNSLNDDGPMAFPPKTNEQP